MAPMRTPAHPEQSRSARLVGMMCVFRTLATGAMLCGGTLMAAEHDGEWRMAAKDYANTRYSSLEQINSGNVKQLEVAWTFSTGLVRGHEAAPLVVAETMYVVTPFPNILYALDLANNGAVKWKYEPQPSRSAQGVACCDVVNRGAVFWEGKIFY